MQAKRISAALAWLALAGSVGAMMILLSYITLYSDDYQYATFFYGGLRVFWEKTVEHYLTCNGRALVHFLAEVFLIFGTRLYVLLFPAMMALTFSLGNTVQREGAAKLAPAAAAVSLCLMMALPVEYLNQTLCWIAGSFNYCFPALLILACFALTLRTLRGGGLAWACLLGFLAGATTEQNGFAALVGGGLIALCALFRAPRGGRPWRVLAPIPFTLIGYLTVLLAPGTATRIAADGESAGTLSVLLNPTLFLQRCGTVMTYLCGKDAEMPSAALLLTALMVLLGLLPLVCRRRALFPLAAGLPCAVCYLWTLSAGVAVAAQPIACIYLALAGVCLLFDRELWMSGVLLISGLSAIGIMIFTNLGAYRTVVPTLILFIAVLVRLAQVYLARLPAAGSWVAGGGVILLCALAALPTFRGYRQNHAVVLRNLDAIETGKASGEIILTADYIDRYRHTLMYEGAYFFTQFKLCYKIPAETQIYLEGEHFLHFPTTVNGAVLEPQCYMTGAVLWLPFVELCAAMDTDIVWDFAQGSGFYLTRNGEQYYLSERDHTITRVSDGAVIVGESYTHTITDVSYLDIASAEAFFDFTYAFDWQTVTIQSNRKDVPQ